MDDIGSTLAIARALADRPGRRRAILAVVLACGIPTYGGVSLFLVAFVVAPVAVALFREADVPHRLMSAAIAPGAFTFTKTAIPGTPAIQDAIPMPIFGTTPFAAPGLGRSSWPCSLVAPSLGPHAPLALGSVVVPWNVIIASVIGALAAHELSVDLRSPPAAPLIGAMSGLLASLLIATFAINLWLKGGQPGD